MRYRSLRQILKANDLQISSAQDAHIFESTHASSQKKPQVEPLSLYDTLGASIPFRRRSLEHRLSLIQKLRGLQFSLLSVLGGRAIPPGGPAAVRRLRLRQASATSPLVSQCHPRVVHWTSRVTAFALVEQGHTTWLLFLLN